MRIGIDLGGTKTEIIALDQEGVELHKKRVPTPNDYESVLSMLAGLVRETEDILGQVGTVGIGIPGTISARTRLVKNANHQVLNGHALDHDLSLALDGRDIRCMNDANCLAISEATDGAGLGQEVVFAVILGTGCGAGLAVNAKGWNGANLVAGEFGHNQLPWMTDAELPGVDCWCGQRGCIENYISGTGFEEDYAHAATGGVVTLKGPGIIKLVEEGDIEATKVLERYADRLSRSLAHVVNFLDPNVIVLGGGMSNVDRLYDMVPQLLSKYVFGGEADTPVKKNVHGDSSGVRGAAWLWAKE